MGTIWNNFKTKWNIKNNIQVLLVLLVFTFTGITTLYFHRWINNALKFSTDTNIILKIIVIIVLIMPIWTLFLYIYGIIFRQQQFFSRFIKTKFNLIKKLSFK